MKASNVIIVLLIIGIVYLGYDNYRLREESVAQNTEVDVDKELLQFYQELSSDLVAGPEVQELFRKKITRQSGSVIHLNSGKKKMKVFREWNRRKPIPNNKDTLKISPYAFGFGLDAYEKFNRYIEEYNENRNRTEEDSIVGVRAYLTRSDTTTKDKKDHYLDLLIIPVLKNGEDLLDLKKGQPLIPLDSMILNSSLPCPDAC